MTPHLQEPRSAAERHVGWRARCLREAGFDQPSAERIARDPAWDLHAVLELVDRGCPPRLAKCILAPLDEGAVPR